MVIAGTRTTRPVEVGLGCTALTAHYQPIVSLKTRATVGYEALARAKAGETPVPPAALFLAAEEAGLALSLDRRCREVALTGFHPSDAHALLFLNLNMAFIDQGAVGSHTLQRQVAAAGLAPGRVVIEILESAVCDLEAMERFVAAHRALGFLIAVDDMGSGCSNLDRLRLIRPDILKIDRLLVRNLHREYYQQALFRSLVSLSRDLGALVIAEGIETEAEAMQALEMGADMLQGFYFAHPAPLATALEEEARACIAHLAPAFTAYRVQQMTLRQAQHHAYCAVLAQIRARLAPLGAAAFTPALAALVEEHPILQCLYVLRDDGVQVSETVFPADYAPRHPSAIFKPAQPDDNHSMKEYFYLLVHTRAERYTTDPYLSLATGTLCRTISMPFRNAGGHRYILCADIACEESGAA